MIRDKVVYLAVSACLALPISAGAEELSDCTVIKQDKTRLSCFDRVAKMMIEAQRQAQAEQHKRDEEAKVALADPNLLKPEQRAQSEAALKLLRKLAAATEVGISLRDYSARLVDISGDFKEATGSLPTSDLRTELERSLGDYVVARELWSAMIQITFSELIQKNYCPMLEKDYGYTPCIVEGRWNNATRSMPVTEESKGRILTAIWKSSTTHAKNAEVFLSQGRLNATPSTSPSANAEAK